MNHALRNYETVVVDAVLIEEAVDCSILNRHSFWDVLVVVSAEKAHCQVLWTEDLNHGQIIRGVRIENPFRDLVEEVHEPPAGTGIAGKGHRVRERRWICTMRRGFRGP